MDKVDLYNPIYHQQYGDKKNICKFTIIGERHSGTNWLERILVSRLQLPLTWEYGSKHFINPSPNHLASGDDTLFVCITRNIYDWIGGFFRLPHHVDKSLTNNLHDFLLYEWKSDIIDKNYWTNKPYKNIFELRKSKLEFIHTLLPYIVQNIVVTRYEDLCVDPEILVSFISDNFGINKTDYKYYRWTKPKPKPSYLFDRDILEIINHNTNWHIEQYFNYSMQNPVLNP